MTKPNGFAFALALCSLALVQSAWSQTFTGTITGVVNDPNSSRIPRAVVHARNEANGEVRQVTTGIDGLYVFSQMPPGSYELSAEVQGFRKAVQTGVVLRVNQTLEVNFSLQLGAVNEIVEVSGGVTLLDTQSANRAVTLDQQTVLDLPVNARNPFQFVHVNAGVIAVRIGIVTTTATTTGIKLLGS